MGRRGVGVRGRRVGLHGVRGRRVGLHGGLHNHNKQKSHLYCVCTSQLNDHE